MNEPGFVYARDAVVFEYRRRPAQLESEDYAIYFRLYGNGRVEYRGFRSQGARQSESLQLSAAETRELVATVVRAGLIEFDVEAAESSLRDRTDRGAGVTSSPDADISSFEILLEEYTPSSGRARQQPIMGLHKKVVWSNLRREARAHPEMTALGALSRLESELTAILGRQEALDGSTEGE